MIRLPMRSSLNSTPYFSYTCTESMSSFLASEDTPMRNFSGLHYYTTMGHLVKPRMHVAKPSKM